MTSLKYTLITDGPSDNALLCLLQWLWRENSIAAEGEWFDPRGFAPPPLSIQQSIGKALELFPCDVLFVHRDAEAQDPEARRLEIEKAVRSAVDPLKKMPYICVVPVRMMEAWFLFDETAIRRAAGNPNGRTALGLPPLSKIEQLSNPKSILIEALRKASGRKGRRLKKLRPHACRARLAELIRDFSPLRQLSAFAHLEADLGNVASHMRSQN